MHALYETYRLWHRLVLKFPKSERYSLGQEAGQMLLRLLQQVLLAASVTDGSRKRIALQTASVQLDTLRILIRLAKDCDCLKNQEYLTLQSQLHHSGKMLGGWLKSLA